MNLLLLLPAGLAALGALLLPLLIHLARRSEQRPTVFAALRWLHAKPRPRHRFRFDELPLLLVRLLLLALLALLLAQPVLRGAEDVRPWIVISPGVDPGVLADTRERAPLARLHWLAPGFPPVDPEGRPPAPSRVSPSSLLRELDARLPAGVRLTVHVPAMLDGVDGERPRLSRAVDWRVAAGAPPIAAVPPVSAPASTSPPRVALRYAPERTGGLRYLRAALAAWSPVDGAPVARPQDVADTAAPLPAKTTALVWLAPGPVPARVADWIRGGGTALLDADATLADAPVAVALWRDDGGHVLVEGSRYGRGRVMRLARPLQPAVMPVLLDSAFPTALRRLFEPAPRSPGRVAAVEHAPATGGVAPTVIPRDLQGPLVLLIALLFLLERVLATGRRARAVA